MPSPKLHWRDVEELGLRLAEIYPQRDPLAVRFTELRQMVETLPDFEPEPDHPCNEAILEAVQAAWIEEKEGGGGEGESSYHPTAPYRPT